MKRKIKFEDSLVEYLLDFSFIDCRVFTFQKRNYHYKFKFFKRRLPGLKIIKILLLFNMEKY